MSVYELYNDVVCDWETTVLSLYPNSTSHWNHNSTSYWNHKWRWLGGESRKKFIWLRHSEKENRLDQIIYRLIYSYDYATVWKRIGQTRSCGFKDSCDCATVWKRTGQTRSCGLKDSCDCATVWKRTGQTRSCGLKDSYDRAKCEKEAVILDHME